MHGGFLKGSFLDTMGREEKPKTWCDMGKEVEQCKSRRKTEIIRLLGTGREGYFCLGRQVNGPAGFFF